MQGARGLGGRKEGGYVLPLKLCSTKGVVTAYELLGNVRKKRLRC